MKIIEGLKNLSRRQKKSVVAIGVFDGVHVGHRKIISTAVKKARKFGCNSVVITFDPHPLDVIRPKNHPTRLTGLSLKTHLIENLGVDTLLIIKFNKTFAKMSAKKFVEDVLINKLRVQNIVVGENFRFGAGAKGDIKYLEETGAKQGFDVEEVPLIKTAEGHKISSTRIRNLLRDGDLESAQEILGHPVFISGVVIEGQGYGSQTGFHTANIETEDKASVPKEGVYTGFTMIGKKRFESVMNIGPSPTFNIKKKRIEVHMLEYNKPLYDNILEIELIARLRDIKKFKDVKSLSKQIKNDIDKAKRILAKA